MASTYVNDLRLNEMATGDESGNWGVVTNLNLELIGEALGYGTEGITTNADTHTTTVADGATDPGRAMYIEYTGTLDSACTITIAPNTLNRMHFIENGTSGSQNIIISQGSGANITIPPGDTKAVYLDGAGSGAAVVDAFASLNVVDLKVQDDLTVTDDATIGGTLGVTGIVTLTDDLIIGDGKTIGSASDVDAITIAANGQLTLTQTLIGTALDISGDIDVDGTSNLDVVDIDGAVDMASTLQVDGAITSSAGATITVADNSDNLTLTSTDADANVGPNLNLYRNSGSPADSDQLGKISLVGRNDNSQDVIYAQIGSQIKDASDGTEDGRIFINSIVAGSTVSRIDMTEGETVFNNDSVDLDFRVESNDEANMIFVNAGGNAVGIGTATPSGRFAIQMAHTETNVTLANNNETLVLGNSGSGDGVYNAIKFSGNQQDMYIMSFNDNTAASRRLGFFLGSVAGDAVADERLSILGDGDIGMGTIAPAFSNGSGLEIERAGPATLRLTDTGSGGKAFEFFADDGTGYQIAGLGSGMPMIFSTVSTERMRIDVSGFTKQRANGGAYFGGDYHEILNNNNTSGERALVIGNKGGDATNNTSSISVTVADTGGDRLYIYGNGNVTNVNNSYGSLSDVKIKENIVDASPKLDNLLQVRVRNYNIIGETNKQIGVVAQELETVFPTMIDETPDFDTEGNILETVTKSVKYSVFVPMLIKAMQEQQTIIEDLKTRIETLEG